MAAGIATSEVFEDAHYDPARERAGDTMLYVRGKYEALLNPESEEILPLELLQARVPDVYWTPPASGFPVSEEPAKRLEGMWRTHLSRVRRGIRGSVYPDE